MAIPFGIIETLAKEHDSFYVYSEAEIEKSISALKRCFTGADILYSIKCNPNKNVLNAVFSRGLGADAASAAEVFAAREAGVSPKDIFYSAPGKSDGDIISTLHECVLIADSLDEVSRIDALLQARSERMNIGLRINPNFTFASDNGAASKFGTDESDTIAFLRENPCRNARISGIHIHLKSQETDAEVLARYYKNVLALARRIADEFGPLEYVNMGSGIGVQYTDAAASLDLDVLGAATAGEYAALNARYPSTRLIIETGRYAVCKSGIYISRVMGRKMSHGKTYIILKNTLNAFMRPALARMIFKYCNECSPAGSEPLFSGADAFEFIAPYPERPCETVTLAGNLCTACDTMAEDITLPRVERGDIVLITNAGSYAAALSPMQFSSQGAVPEIFITKDGKVI